MAGRFGILVHSLPGAADTWATNDGPIIPVDWARSKLDYIEVSR